MANPPPRENPAAIEVTPSQPVAIGVWPATALVVGYTIGVGIFLTPAELIGTVRSPAWTLALWIGCGVLAVAGGLTFGELAARLPKAGGPYVFLREGWGARLAFLYGWQSLLVMDPGVTAALATGVAPYLVVVWPAASGHERGLALGTIWILTLITLLGVRLSARTMTVMTMGKLAALVVVIAVAFSSGTGSWSHFAPPEVAPAGGVPMGVALAIGVISVFFSFGGFWDTSRIADQVERPDRTLPIALTLGVGCVTLVYVATTAAFIYLVPPSQAISATAFAQLAGEAMFGADGARIFAAIVIVSVVSSALGLLIMAPRLYVAMSADGVFPAAFAVVNLRSGTSTRSTLLLAVLASAFSLLGSFRQILTFFMVPTLAFIALAAMALVPLRRRAPGVAGFRDPGYPWTMMGFVTLLTVVILALVINQPLQAIIGLAVVLLGLFAYRMTG